MTSQALTPRSAPAELAPLSDNPFNLAAGQAVYWSSLPSATLEDKAALYAAMTDKATPIADVIGQVIEVEHLIAHGVEMTNEETGEISEQPRIVLLTPTGERYQCVSWGVLKSLKTLIQMLGQVPPFTPPLKLKVQQINTRKGFRTYQLTPAAVANGAGKSTRR